MKISIFALKKELWKKAVTKQFSMGSTTAFIPCNTGFLCYRVKQLEAHQARVENDMHEMDKPLARDKNDEDLDAHLKAVEREEDPMLKYIRKKQTKAKVASGIPRK